MPYLIDGHNLIPKLGMRLDSLDDEMELVAVIQEFCRLGRRQAEIYFDAAPPPQAGTRKLGTVTAHFVPLGTDAIRNRLKKMGKAAKNWTVVSSDRQVHAEARAMQAEVMASEAFAKTIKQMINATPASKGDRTVSENEVKEWLDIFKAGRK
jgi:hypothetical protein